VSQPTPAQEASTAYHQQDIQAANPLQLVARVFEFATVHVTRARAALSKGDLATKGRAVHQLSRCLSLLQGNLDMEKGGDAARNMDRLYTYLHRRISEAHHANDARAFDEVADHLRELGSAWREAARHTPAAGEDAAASSAT
jgi:flagellar protein FliS